MLPTAGTRFPADDLNIVQIVSSLTPRRSALHLYSAKSQAAGLNIVNRRVAVNHTLSMSKTDRAVKVNGQPSATCSQAAGVFASETTRELPFPRSKSTPKAAADRFRHSP